MDGRPERSQAAAVVLIATAVQTLGAVVATSLAVFAPILIDELRLDLGQLGLLVAAMNVGALPALVIGPALVDRLGHGPALAVSAVVSAAGLGVFASGPPFPVMIVALTIVGGSWGLSALSGGGAIVSSAPVGRRGFLIGIRQMGLPLGGIGAGLLAPLVGPFGWQAVFAGQAIAFIVLAVVAGRWRWASAERTTSPWRANPPIRAIQLGVLSVAMTTAQWAFIVYLTFELTQRFALSFGLAAAVFLGSQVVGAIARPALGALSDRLGGSRTPLLAGISAASATLVLAFGLLSPDLPVGIVVALALAAAVFVIGWNGVMVVAMAEAGPMNHVNMQLGAGLTLMRLGNIVAPPLFGAILALAGSLVAWTVMAAILGIAAVGFVLIGRAPARADRDGGELAVSRTRPG